MKRILLGALAAVALLGIQVLVARTWGAENVQANVAGLTLIASLWFGVIFMREPWWRTWFGWSLMLLAAALFTGALATVLYRRLGGDYPGREAVYILAADLALLAMVIRIGVLHHARKRGRRGPLDH